MSQIIKKSKQDKKGITLITLTVAICILIIILSVLVYNAQNGIKMRNLKMMQNDIEILNDKIDAYYVKYGALPIEYRYTNIKFEPQENDSGEYYVIDINALDGVTLNYGEDYSKITETTTEAEMQENEDVYVIDKQSHHVYYARGIEMDGQRYYTNTIDEGIELVEIQKNVIATLEKTTKGWAREVTLVGNGRIKESAQGKAKIVGYTFVNGDTEPTEWTTIAGVTETEQTTNVTENGIYYFWLKDNEDKIYKSNMVEVNNVDRTNPTIGSLIAKKENAEGEDYEYGTRVETDVYVDKIDGTDGESGHLKTTITIQKDGLTVHDQIEEPVTLTETGTYIATVTTTDNAGNISTTEPKTIIIDKRVPVLTLKHNDENGEEYESGTWTKDDLYGEININSLSGHDVEKYQYSYNGVVWNDISNEDIPMLDYTTTFPLKEEGKPVWFSGPINGNDTYNFKVQADGTLKPNNSDVNSTKAQSYFEIDLTRYPEAKLEVKINATISSEDGSDYGYADITESPESPDFSEEEEVEETPEISEEIDAKNQKTLEISEDTDAKNQETPEVSGEIDGSEDSEDSEWAGKVFFISVSGNTETSDHITTIQGGKKYYLHIEYSKDESLSSGQDTFIINNISLKLSKRKKFYEYNKVENKASFKIKDEMDKDIYVRAVYEGENNVSKYANKKSIKIDKTAPIIKKENAMLGLKNTSKVEIKVEEEASGLKGYYISTEETEPTQSSTWTEQVLKEFIIENLTTNTTYYLWLIDNAGNISEKSELVTPSINYLVDDITRTETLEQALEQARDGSTIKLLNNYTDESVATINKNNIIFDVQGYTLTRDKPIIINSDKTVEITGTGKIIDEEDVSVNEGNENEEGGAEVINEINTIENLGSLTITNSIIIENNSEDNSSIYLGDKARLNINNEVKIIGYNKTIHTEGEATLNINGGYVEATNSSNAAFAIYNESICNTNINGGRISGYTGIYNCNSSSRVTLNDGKIIGVGADGIGNGNINIIGGRVEGKTYGINGYSSESIISMGREEDELSTTKPAVYGGNYGIYNPSNTFNFYNGVIISEEKTRAYSGNVKTRAKHVTKTYMDNEVEHKYCTILVVEPEPSGIYAVLVGDSLKFYTSKEKALAAGGKFYGNVQGKSFTRDNEAETVDTPWFVDRDKIKSAEFVDELVPEYLAYFFSDLDLLETVNMKKVNTIHVKDMYGMFLNCKKIKEIDTKSFDTRNVENMGWMFLNCASLTKLDVSSFDTRKVTNMEVMFSGCENLTELDVSNFNTSNVTSMRSMFANMKLLRTLDLSNFNTKNVENMETMFFNDYNLESVNLLSFNTRKMTTMRKMFQWCRSLEILDLSSFFTASGTDIAGMFTGTGRLEKIYIGPDWNHYIDLLYENGEYNATRVIRKN